MTDGVVQLDVETKASDVVSNVEKLTGELEHAYQNATHLRDLFVTASTAAKKTKEEAEALKKVLADLKEQSGEAGRETLSNCCARRPLATISRSSDIWGARLRTGERSVTISSLRSRSMPSEPASTPRPNRSRLACVKRLRRRRSVLSRPLRMPFRRRLTRRPSIRPT